MVREIEVGDDTAEVINELGKTFDTPDDVLQRLIKEAGYEGLLKGEPAGEKEYKASTPSGEKYVITLSNSDGLLHNPERGDVLKQIGGEDQSQVMANAVNYLIQEHNLIERISPLPYVPGRKKAVINNQPTYPDSEEHMRHYKKLEGGYYLDTHYKKEDKIRRMREIARECGLSAQFEGEWG